MPETLARVESMVQFLDRRDVMPVTLLVTGGRGWKRRHVRRLRVLERMGCELAGHGWKHVVHARRRTIYHRLHALTISRDTAEHLSLPSRHVLAIVKKAYEWFGQHGIEPPPLYVPPAWAMGAARRGDLAILPFRYYESLTGVYDSSTHRNNLLPMVGYEADTAFRALAVRTWNAANVAIAEKTGRPLRIGLHPYDFELLLKQEAQDIFDEPYAWMSYGEL